MKGNETAVMEPQVTSSELPQLEKQVEVVSENTQQKSDREFRPYSGQMMMERFIRSSFEHVAQSFGAHMNDPHRNLKGTYYIVKVSGADYAEVYAGQPPEGKLVATLSFVFFTQNRQPPNWGFSHMPKNEPWSTSLSYTAKEKEASQSLKSDLLALVRVVRGWFAKPSERYGEIRNLKKAAHGQDVGESFYEPPSYGEYSQLDIKKLTGTSGKVDLEMDDVKITFETKVGQNWVRAINSETGEYLGDAMLSSTRGKTISFWEAAEDQPRFNSIRMRLLTQRALDSLLNPGASFAELPLDNNER